MSELSASNSKRPEPSETEDSPENNSISSGLRKLGILLLSGASVLGASGCQKVNVGPGEEGVIVKKPVFTIFFGNGGVVPEATKTGSEYRALSTDIILVDVIPKQYDEQFDDMQSKDNIPVDFNAYIKLRVKNSPMLIEKFGADWYRNNVQEPFRTSIRDECKRRNMTELTVGEHAVAEIQTGVAASMKTFVEKADIPVEVVSVVVGKISPPEEVLHEIAATGAQQQRAKTEDMRKSAEEMREKAETARAAADNAYRNALGLTPDQFIELERIHAFEKIGTKVADSQGNTLILSTGNSPSTVIPVQPNH